ncbi:response regulator transcription factor [Treponema sp.]|uniref:response regulator transcription factor n=1 Tax=Treponema sp. TaxID=166 RepID=UPI00298DA727|nr:response regulator transcription factor [Treponema sp.]MCQ2240365.1 response regulator transcription factor [Treponema sp.]
MNLILLDDHEAILNGLCFFFEKNGISVLEKFTTGEELVEYIDKNKGPDFNPVVICDLQLENGFAFETIEKLKEQKCKVVVYTMFRAVNIIFRAFRCGACGFVFKNQEIKTLLEVVKTVDSGKTYIPPEVLSDYISGITVYSVLTSKEQKILDYMMDNKNNDEIALALNVTTRTIENSFSRIYDKTGVKNKKELRRKIGLPD